MYYLQSIECFICRSVFAAAIQGLQDGQSDEQIIDVLTNLCTSLGLVSGNVCKGTVALNIVSINSKVYRYPININMLLIL